MSRKALLAALLASFPISAVAQEATRPEIPQVLRRPIRQGQSIEGYLTQVMQPFRFLLQGKSEIDAQSLRQRRDAAQLQAEQSGVAQVIIYDTNSDAKVSEDEIRAGLKARAGGSAGEMNAGMLANVERQVQQFMAGDTNKDGVLDLAEMRALGAQNANRGMNSFANADEYLALFPSGTSLSAALLFKRAQATFESLDLNGDTVLSQEEVQAATASPPPRPDQPMARPLPPLAKPVGKAVCELPKPEAGDKVLAYGTYEGSAYSTAALGDMSEETRTGVVNVEKGAEPLYIVLSNFNPVIWRFEGAVERVRKVVLTTDHGKAPTAGVVGLPKDRVVATAPGECLKLWYKAESIEGAVARGVLSGLLERKPDAIAGSYTAHRVSVPSMEVDDGKNAQRGMMGGGMAFHGVPGGLVEIDAKAVVADGPVAPYDIMPGMLGISQLVSAGALVDLGNQQYRIAKTFAHFPARMTGMAGQAKFLLGTGVKLPAGTPGWACIISEETGRPANNSPMCR